MLLLATHSQKRRPRSHHHQHQCTESSCLGQAWKKVEERASVCSTPGCFGSATRRHERDAPQLALTPFAAAVLALCTSAAQDTPSASTTYTTPPLHRHQHDPIRHRAPHRTAQQLGTSRTRTLLQSPPAAQPGTCFPHSLALTGHAFLLLLRARRTHPNGHLLVTRQTTQTTHIATNTTRRRQ